MKDRINCTQNVLRLQAALGMNNEDFSRLIGITSANISKYRHQSSVPNRTTLKKVANLIGCDPKVLEEPLGDREIDLMVLAMNHGAETKRKQPDNLVTITVPRDIPLNGNGSKPHAATDRAKEIQPDLFPSPPPAKRDEVAAAMRGPGVEITVKVFIPDDKISHALDAVNYLLSKVGRL